MMKRIVQELCIPPWIFQRALICGVVIDKDANFSCTLKVGNIEPKILNGRKVSIKADLQVDISVYSNKEKEFVCSIADENQMQRISDSVKLNSLIGNGETVCSAKDTINFDENVADILRANFTIKNQENKTSYNKVLTKADCVVDILYLSEDEGIRSKSVSIPVTGFIDVPGISDNAICKSSYEVKNIDLKLNNSEERSASVDVDFFVSCQVYEEREFNMIQDLYSPEENIVLTEEQINSIQNKRIIRSTQNMTEKVNVSTVKDVYAVNATAENVSKSVSADAIEFEGNLNVDYICESSSTGRLEQGREVIKFSHSIDISGIDNASKFDVQIDVNVESFVVASDGTMEVNVVFNYSIDVYSIVPINIISDVKIEKVEALEKKSSLIIYFVKEGDTLWKIAKKFRSTMDEIAEANNLENIDSLKVGEQLFIPRYSGNIA